MTIHGADRPGDGPPERRVDVLVVGAGPAGLAAAAALAARGAGRVEVLDREQEAGGIPRHCAHPGFGVRDLHRVLSGPQYARRLTGIAVDAGAVVRTGVTVTGWAPGPDDTAWPVAPAAITGEGGRVLETTSPAGLERIRARVVLLATGARERSRAARLIPGDRPAGVFTTGHLQQAVHRYGQDVGGHAVVVGGEQVSYSAVITLRRAGVEVTAMLTDESRPQSHPALRAGSLLRYGVRVVTGVAVTRIVGTRRVEAVEITRTDGQTALIRCDTVVLTGDWIPDHELARRGGLACDPGTHGPAVDPGSRTSAAGVFAIGNLVHPVQSADRCAREGRRSATAVLDELAGGDPDHWATRWAGSLPVEAVAPLRWVCPNRIDPSDPQPSGLRLIVCPGSTAVPARLEVAQGDRLLFADRPRRLRPGQPYALGGPAVRGLDPRGGPVTVRLS